jgi:hypothetical protein
MMSLLGTGGIIKKALENNASVKVVMMTNGDGMGMDQFSNYWKVPTIPIIMVVWVIET